MANQGAFIGSDEYRYEVVNWPTVPDGWVIGDVGGIAVDDQDRIYVLSRGEHPILVFSREGDLLSTWGQGCFVRPHGIDIGPEGTIYCTDDGSHSVLGFRPGGQKVLELGLPGTSSPFMSGEPFNKCTHTALSPEGDIYVADGYGNARVHKYSPSGRLLKSWGQPGIGPGEFNFPHNICCDHGGWVYVADRENHRVQVFDGEGRFETQWNSIHRPCALCAANHDRTRFVVGEVGPVLRVNRATPNLGPRLSIMTAGGEVVARIGDKPAGPELCQFVAPHGLAVDSRGDIYVGEVSLGAWPQFFPDREVPPNLRTIRKLVHRPQTSREAHGRL